ncbi:MAG: hypothetical protein IJD95_00940 [Clostridia bacterium]|nr:hypothetical protein [Clostridia bacterium]
MKRLFALFIAAALLLCTVACAPNGPEMFSKALSLTDFGDKLENMQGASVGTGVFKDYLYVHSNPTKIAELPLDITAESKRIANNSDGLSEFLRSVAKKYGFANEYLTDCNEATDIDGALDILFAAAKDNSGLAEAKAAAANISEELKPALTKYLCKAAKAYALYAECAAKVSDTAYGDLQSYRFCAPATSNPFPLKNAYSVSLITGETKLLVAGMLITEAGSELAKALKDISKLTVNGEALSFATPAGNIILGSSDNDVYSSPEAFLLIDISGNDRYNGSIAASISKKKPISAVFDLKGDDIYDSTTEKVPSQGAGILGAGLLFDMDGNDSYNAIRASQGFALLGVGILFDANGDDKYRSEVSSQSCGYFGISALADMAGNDSYYAFGHSQATAGNRAMAFLIEKGGNDKYYVETFVQDGYKDMQYDQFPYVNGNWSQGCAAGNRSVSTNGNGLAGGIAGLIDLGGDDIYNGGVWVQGVGYWSGYGFLSDIGGNDKYNSRYYSHASVAHYGAAALIDIGGNDKHLVQYSGDIPAGEGASHSFVWDRGVTLLVDDGGNDIYDSLHYSFATSWSEYDSKGFEHQDMSYAFFIETEGNDEYPTMASQSFGWGRGGFFFDLKGEDKYRDKSYYDGLTRTDTAGIFHDSDKGGHVSFWTEARKKFGI